MSASVALTRLSRLRLLPRRLLRLLILRVPCFQRGLQPRPVYPVFLDPLVFQVQNRLRPRELICARLSGGTHDIVLIQPAPFLRFPVIDFCWWIADVPQPQIERMRPAHMGQLDLGHLERQCLSCRELRLQRHTSHREHSLPPVKSVRGGRRGLGMRKAEIGRAEVGTLRRRMDEICCLRPG